MLRATVVLVLLAAGFFWLADSVLSRPPGGEFPEVVLDHSRPKPQGGFYRCPVEEPKTLNPFVGSSAVLRQYVLPFTHDALLDHDPRTGRLRPALAVREPETAIVEGKPEYTFELRDGVRFSDGTPVTMDDVEFTVNAARSDALPLGEITYATSEVDSFSRISDRLFRLRMKDFTAAGYESVATQLRVVQKRWFEARLAEMARKRGLDVPEPNTTAFSDCLAAIDWPGPGTGPYRFHEGRAAWRSGTSLTITQNEHCWRRSVQPEAWNLAGIQLRFTPQLALSETAALNGTIDYLVGNHEYEDLLEKHERLRKTYRLETYVKMRAVMQVIEWNCRNAPLNRPRVRRALAMLFDNRRLAEKVYLGHADVARSWFPPGSEQIAPELEPISFDPKAAAKILAAEGCAGMEFQIVFASESKDFRRQLDLAAEGFQAAGVNLKPVPIPFRQIETKIATHDFLHGALNFAAHTPVRDPSIVFHSKNARSGYANARLDDLFQRVARATNPVTRLEAQHEISRILHRDQPVTPMLFPRIRVLLHQRFQGVEVGPLGLFPERWWVARN